MRNLRKPSSTATASPPPTTRDVAQLAGVSRATVSFVLNGCAEGRVGAETHERVLRAAETLGYRPNRVAAALSTGRTYTIGIASELGDYRDVAATAASYTKNVFLALTIAAARAGLNTSLFVETLDLELKPEDVADGRVDGLVVFGMYENHDWVRRVVALGLPCVEIGTHWGRYRVEADNAGGARLAVEHLTALGHRRIAHYVGIPAGVFVLSATQREAGFRTATADAGLTLADTPIAYFPEDLAALFADDIPIERQPTAIVNYNDAAAVDARDILQTLGRRVPEDVSLVGFDNELRAVITRPALTTVINPVDELARAAVALLRRLMEGEALEETTIRVPTELIVRQSTAPPQS